MKCFFLQDFQRKAERLKTIVHVFSDMFEEEVDLYWISVKFLNNQQQFTPHWDNMVRAAGYHGFCYFTETSEDFRHALNQSQSFFIANTSTFPNSLASSCVRDTVVALIGWRFKKICEACGVKQTRQKDDRPLRWSRNTEHLA